MDPVTPMSASGRTSPERRTMSATPASAATTSPRSRRAKQEPREQGDEDRVAVLEQHGVAEGQALHGVEVAGDGGVAEEPAEEEHHRPLAEERRAPAGGGRDGRQSAGGRPGRGRWPGWACRAGASWRRRP